MSQEKVRGISREGVGAAFEAAEARKSELILEARLLREEQQYEAAAARFAEAAEIEGHLSDLCEANGLMEKSFMHRFSAASCWAQAGNFFDAIALCERLLAQDHLPERLRQRVHEYAETLRSRRAEWYAGLVLETAASEM
jgi:tetratricopeptide (TPR) repeat protein